MTQIANATVKNGANIDAVFTAYQPQSGSDPAVWYCKTGATRDRWVRFTAQVRRTANEASKLKLNVTIPLFDATGKKIGSIPSSLEITIPDISPAEEIQNIQAYLANLLDNATVKDMILTASPAI